MPCDRPQDIYGIVAEKVVQKVMQSTHEFAIGWQQLEINRSLVKRPVMTLPYGVTLFKVKQYLSDHLRVEVKKGTHNPFGDEIRRPTAWLGDIVWECIKETVSGAVEIMDCSRSVSRFLSRTTPRFVGSPLTASWFARLMSAWNATP